MRYKMHVHPINEDKWISASVATNNGNEMFEMMHKMYIYKILRGVGRYRRPIDPLFLDIGANIGSTLPCFLFDGYIIDPTGAMCAGIHALFTAALGIRTHAFEPLARNLEKLECSAANNAVIGKHLVINGFGLSDKASDGGCLVWRGASVRVLSAFVTVFHHIQVVDADNQGNAMLQPQSSNCTQSSIKLRTLDAYWEQVWLSH